MFTEPINGIKYSSQKLQYKLKIYQINTKY